MNERQQRGLIIAATTQISASPEGWLVPSQTGNGTGYVVDPEKQCCTCPDHETRQVKCKHIYAVEFTIQREMRPDGKVTETKTLRVTYQQDWPAYNAAQTHEQEQFASLLRGLCNGIPQPPQSFGRPRLPLSDVVFGIGLKVYSTMSGRRVMSEIREAQGKGLLDKAPSFTSTFRYLENPELTPLLKALIEQSAMPLRSVETDFAVDSSGFASTVYNRWFDHKWGKVKSEAKWVKAHLMCGVNTHIVTSVEVTPTESADAPQLPALLAATAQRFSINEVSADKAYSSRKNLHAIDAVGASPYIPFKNRTTGMGSHSKSFDGLWNRMWHYYNFNQAVFMEHYHKRSNVETAYSMIKAKFGGAVRSKTPVAQVNEVLVKILCHNICVLIQSWYELGIAATFGTEMATVPKVSLN